jgi:hypothetical protein
MAHRTPVTGFAHRLAYLRWLRNRGRVKAETDAEVSAWLGVGLKWLGKWKTRRDAPEGRTEARAVSAALRAIGVELDWLYDGAGDPPEPERWGEWLARVPVEVIPAPKPRRSVKKHIAQKEKAAKGGGRQGKRNGKAG